jgi:uncharacterized protein YkwD
MLRRLGLITLPLAGFLCALLLLSGGAQANNVCTPDSSWGTLNTGFAGEVLTLINQHRASIGEAPLTSDWALTDSAQWKSMNMSGFNYLDHPDDPIGRSVEQRLLDCGYPASTSGWGENIAEGYSTPSSVVQAWLNSPGHRANIEDAGYRTTGIGVAETSQGVFYWTQEFGTVSSPQSGTTTTVATTGTTGTTTGTTTASPPPPTTTASVVTPSIVRLANGGPTPVAAHPKIVRRRHYVVVQWKLKRHAGRPDHYLVLWKHKLLAETTRRTIKLSKRLHGRIRIVAVMRNGARERAISVSL